jgi:hypothetical protein
VNLRSFIAGLGVALLLVTQTGKANAYTHARHIIYHVFPRQTAPKAMRVMGCETGYTYSPRAFNRSSRATGFFQILQGNHGRVLHYRGRTLRIEGRRLWGGWYNARVALFLSHGGWDWSEWECQP